MPKKSPHPHVAWRDGRPRFQPGPELRELGHVGTDLRWPDPAPASWKPVELRQGDRNAGRWFSRGEAVDWSEAFTKALDRKPKKPARVKKPAAPAPAQPARKSVPSRADPAYTVAQLFEDWWRSAKFQLPDDPAELQRQRSAGNVLSPATIADYKQKARVIEQEDPELWAAPAAALMTPIVYGLYDDLRAKRGIATARGAIAALSAALGWGRRRGKFDFAMNQGANPAHDLEMATPPARVRFGTRTEILTLVAAADAIGMPQVGDGTLLGVWTGQRQGDRIALQDRGLMKGRRIFRQSKTNVIVAVKEPPQLKARLTAAAERRRAAKAEALLAAATPEERRKVEERFARVILNEHIDERFERCLWNSYEGKTYSRAFAEVRAAAIAGVVDQAASEKAGRTVWKVEPCPSLEDFFDRDLRDTAVTWMALAGATIPEIISVTGHTAQSATRILRHYLAMHPEMADSAIGKMVAWYDEGGETEIGF